jgi:hypothetical protein
VLIPAEENWAVMLKQPREDEPKFKTELLRPAVTPVNLFGLFRIGFFVSERFVRERLRQKSSGKAA